MCSCQNGENNAKVQVKSKITDSTVHSTEMADISVLKYKENIFSADIDFRKLFFLGKLHFAQPMKFTPFSCKFPATFNVICMDQI